MNQNVGGIPSILIIENLQLSQILSGLSVSFTPHILHPFTVQQYARHKDFRTTMIYNRPTQQQMKADIRVTANEIKKQYTGFVLGPLFLNLQEL